jgi:hypothetical protein
LIFAIALIAGAIGFWVAQADLMEIPSQYNPLLYYRLLDSVASSPFSGWFDETWQAARDAKQLMTWYGAASVTCGSALLWGGPQFALRAGRCIQLVSSTYGAQQWQPSDCPKSMPPKRQYQKRAICGINTAMQCAKQFFPDANECRL